MSPLARILLNAGAAAASLVLWVATVAGPR